MAAITMLLNVYCVLDIMINTLTEISFIPHKYLLRNYHYPCFTDEENKDLDQAVQDYTANK